MDTLSATRQPNDEMKGLRTQMNGIIGNELFQWLALDALAIALAPPAFAAARDYPSAAAFSPASPSRSITWAARSWLLMALVRASLARFHVSRFSLTNLYDSR